MKDDDQKEMKEFNISKDISDYELLQFIQCVEENDMIKAPIQMKEEILKKSKSPVIRIAVESKKVSKKVQLFWYSLKISAAVAIALTLLIFISIPANIVPSVKTGPVKKEWNITEKIYDRSTQVTNILGKFSDKILFF